MVKFSVYLNGYVFVMDWSWLNVCGHSSFHWIKKAIFSYWQKYVHKVSVNCLEEGLNLPRKKYDKVNWPAQHDSYSVDWAIKLQTKQTQNLKFKILSGSKQHYLHKIFMSVGMFKVNLLFRTITIPVLKFQQVQSATSCCAKTAEWVAEMSYSVTSWSTQCTEASLSLYLG